MTEPRPSDVLLWCLCGYLVILLVAVLVILLVAVLVILR